MLPILIIKVADAVSSEVGEKLIGIWNMLSGSSLISRLSINFSVSVSSVKSSKSILQAELNGFLKLINAEVVSFSLHEIYVTAISLGMMPVPDTI